MKIILILCDGMRPDALSNIPQVQEMKQKASYTMTATTVMPSVTLLATCLCSTAWIPVAMVLPPILTCPRYGPLMACVKC